VLAYVAGSTLTGSRELVWVSREGVATPVDSAWAGDLSGRPTLSPDGRAAAIVTGQGPARQVWVKQLDRGPVSRVADAGSGASWSPDGKELVFASPSGIQRVPADGSRLPVAVHSLTVANPSFSPDGKWLLFTSRGDILGVQTSGDTAIKVLVSDQGNQAMPALSPDGRWLAYASDEAANWQIYVRPFPDTKVAKRQVSVGAGYAPRWSRNGRELFYYDPNGDFWSAEIAPGPVFSSGTPKRLFSALPFGSLINNFFDVSPDGKRFLFSRSKLSGLISPRQDELILVQNFFEELKAKVK
jgi:Tol biopolymer transport system component